MNNEGQRVAMVSRYTSIIVFLKDRIQFCICYLLLYKRQVQLYTQRLLALGSLSLSLLTRGHRTFLSRLFLSSLDAAVIPLPVSTNARDTPCRLSRTNRCVSMRARG